MAYFWHAAKIAAPNRRRQVSCQLLHIVCPQVRRKIALLSRKHVKMSRPEFPMATNQQATGSVDDSSNRMSFLLRAVGFAFLALGFALIHFVPNHMLTGAVRWFALALLGVAGLRKR